MERQRRGQDDAFKGGREKEKPGSASSASFTFLCALALPTAQELQGLQRFAHRTLSSFLSVVARSPRRRRPSQSASQKRKRKKTWAFITCRRRKKRAKLFLGLFPPLNCMRFALSSSVPRLRPPLTPLRPVLRTRPSYLLVSFSKRRGESTMKKAREERVVSFRWPHALSSSSASKTRMRLCLCPLASTSIPAIDAMAIFLA